MKIIDSDLLSIQEARILIEEAKTVREDLLKIDKDERLKLLAKVKGYYKKNLDLLTASAFEETCYGKKDDEKKLLNYYLENLDSQMARYPNLFDIIDGDNEQRAVTLPKGISVVFIAPYLVNLTTFQAIYFAIRSASPLIIVSDSRCKKTVTKVVKDIMQVGEDLYYPKGFLAMLEYNSILGERTLTGDDNVSFIIENILNKDKREFTNDKADVFYAEIGNNIVFIDKSADIDQASLEIINSKACNNGLLPGVEQAIVVEASVVRQVKESFEKHGAYFLTRDQHICLEKILYDDCHQVRKELIGRSAKEIAKIANIKVHENTKVLIVTKPYVSKKSPYSKEKYNPILSFYVEDDWLNACEKCVELILNDKKGQSLSIYSNDAYVIEQFIEKKPVARVLVNAPTGFGSIGIGTNLPLTFSLSTKKIAGESGTSLIPNHFMKFKEIGIAKDKSLAEFLKSIT